MYKDLNDYEILYIVGENSDNTFDFLCQKYKPLIYKEVKKYAARFKKYGYEMDDLMQIGLITLYKASYLYNDSSDSMFYTYYRKSLINALNTEIRNNETLKKKSLNDAISYDIEIPNTDILYRDIFESKKIDYKEEFNRFLIVFKNSLSFDEGNIFELYYNGYNVKEISILLDKDIKSVNIALKGIKEHALTYKYLFLNQYVLQ